MNVFYTTLPQPKSKIRRIDKKITGVLKEAGNRVSSDIELFEDESVELLSFKKGIAKANAVIVRSDKDNFELGYLVSVALNAEKPVLILSRNSDFSTLVADDKFYTDNYQNPEAVKNSILKFLQSVHDNHLAIRKNIYMTPQQSKFIDKVGKEQDTSASKIVRELINEKMAEYESH